MKQMRRVNRPWQERAGIFPEESGYVMLHMKPSHTTAKIADTGLRSYEEALDRLSSNPDGRVALLIIPDDPDNPEIVKELLRLTRLEPTNGEKPLFPGRKRHGDDATTKGTDG